VILFEWIAFEGWMSLCCGIGFRGWMRFLGWGVLFGGVIAGLFLDGFEELLNDGFGAASGCVELGDGCDGAEAGIEDYLFDEAVALLRDWEEGAGWGGVGTIVAGGGGGAGLAGEVDGGGTQGVEEETAALRVELVEGDAAGDFSDGELEGGAVFKAGQVECGVGRDEAGGSGGRTVGVVEVAEVLSAEGRRAAAAASGMDVAADIAVRFFVHWSLRRGVLVVGCWLRAAVALYSKSRADAG
jgi:hypothetical protein